MFQVSVCKKQALNKLQTVAYSHGRQPSLSQWVVVGPFLDFFENSLGYCELEQVFCEERLRELGLLPAWRRGGSGVWHQGL